MDIVSDKTVKTKKPHRCWGCTKEYPKASIMRVVVCKNDSISRAYWCEKCTERINKMTNDQRYDYFNAGEGMLYGGLVDQYNK